MNEPVSIDGAEHVHDLLSDYLNDDLADAQRQLVQAHLATCPTCRRDYESLRLTVHLVRQVPLRAVPHPFTVAAPPQRRWSLAWLRFSTSALAAVFVAVFALQFVLPTSVHPAVSTSRALDAAARVQSASSAPSSAAPEAAPRAAEPFHAAAQATPKSGEAPSGQQAAASSAAVPAAAVQAVPAAAPAVPPSGTPAGALSGPAGNSGVASNQNLAKSAPASARAPLPPSASNGRAATVTEQPRLPAWYLPLLVAVSVLLVASLAGLIWASALR
ncbi:MAG: anti-sigma factor family protein [Chloroflexota bacterium]